VSAAKRSSLAGLQPAAPAAAPPMPTRRAAAPPADAQTPEDQTPEVQSPGGRKEKASVVREAAPPRPQRSVRAQRSRTPEVQTPELPKYLRLERKELLIWPDQITQLSILARSLNRKRRGEGERITMNTLIRVFVAAGLSRAGELAGATEDELRRSLGLAD
jgi:hypothetical protein